MLKKLIDNNLTDKNTVHSYLDTYEELFKNRKNIKNLLEIGIDKGGSLRLWKDYFVESENIIGMDITDKNIKCEKLDDVQIIICDAYDKKNIPTDKKFDIIIDDGPHTFESVMKFLFYYLPLLTDDGIVIIEDIQYIEWINLFNIIIEEHYPELVKYIRTYDLRGNKGRYDDVLYVIDKRKE